MASAVADCLVAEAGGRTIGISGGWGSGKSTVVGLVQKRLEEVDATGATKLFVFDAWAHGGDPLRRSFLESLIEFLTGENWLKREEWNRELEVLSHRREDVESETHPVLTKLGLALIVALLLTPIGFALFANFTSPDLLHYDAFGLVPLWCVGVAIALAPLVVLTAAFVFGKGGQDGNEELVGLIPLLLNKTVESTKTRTRRTPEPTSLEFSGVFCRILDDALAEGTRRLAIVIDNLDRVAEEDALAIWSTMRVFFEHGSPTSPGWQDRLWLLVPFDSRSISRFWEPSEEGTEFAQSFEDKTFQVIFRVSPPLLSDWRAFLLAQLELAMPKHDKADFESVYRIFRRLGLSAARNLTPRDIKTFVNKVGALHRQWQDEIPLSVQAYYVLKQEEVSGSARELTDSDWLDGRLANELDEGWQRQMAALHFNVPTEKSLQVLLEKQIDEYLASEDFESLLDVSAVPGFEEVIEDLVESSHGTWRDSDPTLIATTARALEAISAQPGSSDLARAWRYLSIGAEGVERWDTLNQDVVEGLVLIYERSGEARRSLAPKLISSVGKSVVEVSEGS